jgi:hypothetical protein
MSNIPSSNPKATVTALTTGLESLSALIKDQTLQRICIIISPGIALALTYFYGIKVRSINCKKGIKEYKQMISDFESELNSPNINEVRKVFLQSEIEKCWIRINELRTDNIKIITK